MPFKLFEVLLLLRLSSLLKFVSFVLFLVFAVCTCRLSCLRTFWVVSSCCRLLRVVFCFSRVPKIVWDCFSLFTSLGCFRWLIFPSLF